MRLRFTSGLAALCALQMLWLAPAQAARSTETPDAFASNHGRFVTPPPPYPFLVDGDTLIWAARVAFDEHGDATEALIIRSTGSAPLDVMITKWIKGHWKALGGKPTTLVTSAK